MRIIITGAGGLLGHGLALAAHRAGHDILGIGRSANPPANLTCDHWLAADLADQTLADRNWSDWRDAPVFHLAGDTRIYEAGRNFARANLVTTATACAIARRTGGRLVFFSSAAVYSGARTRRTVQALRESDETVPVGDYGRTKHAAEELIRKTCEDAVILRLFGVLSGRLAGWSERGNLVQAIVRAWRTDTEVLVATDEMGEPMVRDYVLEEDVCQCALAALNWARPQIRPLVVNVCTGEPTTVEEMVALAARAGRRAISQRRQRQPGETNPVMLGDPSLLRRLHGKVPSNKVADFWARLLPSLAPAP